MKFKLYSQNHSFKSESNYIKMKQYRDLLFKEGYSVVYAANNGLEEYSDYYFITIYVKSLKHLDKLVKVLSNDVIYSGDGYLTIDEGVFK